MNSSIGIPVDGKVGLKSRKTTAVQVGEPLSSKTELCGQDEQKTNKLRLIIPAGLRLDIPRVLNPVPSALFCWLEGEIKSRQAYVQINTRYPSCSENCFPTPSIVPSYWYCCENYNNNSSSLRVRKKQDEGTKV